MSKTFADHLAADRRLCILKLLVEGNGQLGESAIEHGLKLLGHVAGVYRGYVLQELEFLKNLELIELDVFGAVTVAAITRKGEAVANGILAVEGVLKPSLAR